MGGQDLFPHQRIKNRDPYNLDGPEIWTDTPLSYPDSRPASGEVYEWSDLRPPTTAIARVAGPTNQKTPDAILAQVRTLLQPRTRTATDLIHQSLFVAGERNWFNR